MQSPVIPATEAPTDLSGVRLLQIVGSQFISIPAIGLGNAFGFQPLDQGLTDIAGLAVTDGNFIVGNGTNWVAESGATARTSLGLGTAATQNTGTSGASVPLLNGTNTWSGVQTLSAIPDLTSGGIKFPATQVASADANTLDDYEEGTFTPAFAATGATFSYSVQTGKYTKIGRFLMFDIALILNTSGNTLTANVLTITGLPFSAASGAGTNQVRWVGSTTSYVQVVTRPSGASLILEVWTAATTNTAVFPNANALLHATNGTDLRIIGVYNV